MELFSFASKRVLLPFGKQPIVTIRRVTFCTRREEMHFPLNLTALLVKNLFVYSTSTRHFNGKASLQRGPVAESIEPVADQKVESDEFDRACPLSLTKFLLSSLESSVDFYQRRPLLFHSQYCKFNYLLDCFRSNSLAPNPRGADYTKKFVAYMKQEDEIRRKLLIGLLRIPAIVFAPATTEKSSLSTTYTNVGAWPTLSSSVADPFPASAPVAQQIKETYALGKDYSSYPLSMEAALYLLMNIMSIETALSPSYSVVPNYINAVLDAAQCVRTPFVLSANEHYRVLHPLIFKWLGGLLKDFMAIDVQYLDWNQIKILFEAIHMFGLSINQFNSGIRDRYKDVKHMKLNDWIIAREILSLYPTIMLKKEPFLSRPSFIQVGTYQSVELSISMLKVGNKDEALCNRLWMFSQPSRTLWGELPAPCIEKLTQGFSLTPVASTHENLKRYRATLATYLWPHVLRKNEILTSRAVTLIIWASLVSCIDVNTRCDYLISRKKNLEFEQMSHKVLDFLEKDNNFIKGLNLVDLGLLFHAIFPVFKEGVHITEQPGLAWEQPDSRSSFNILKNVCEEFFEDNLALKMAAVCDTHWTTAIHIFAGLVSVNLSDAKLIPFLMDRILLHFDSHEERIESSLLSMLIDSANAYLPDSPINTLLYTYFTQRCKNFLLCPKEGVWLSFYIWRLSKWSIEAKHTCCQWILQSMSMRPGSSFESVLEALSMAFKTYGNSYLVESQALLTTASHSLLLFEKFLTPQILDELLDSLSQSPAALIHIESQNRSNPYTPLSILPSVLIERMLAGPYPTSKQISRAWEILARLRCYDEHLISRLLHFTHTLGHQMDFDEIMKFLDASRKLQMRSEPLLMVMFNRSMQLVKDKQVHTLQFGEFLDYFLLLDFYMESCDKKILQFERIHNQDLSIPTRLSILKHITFSKNPSSTDVKRLILAISRECLTDKNSLQRIQSSEFASLYECFIFSLLRGILSLNDFKDSNSILQFLQEGFPYFYCDTPMKNGELNNGELNKGELNKGELNKGELNNGELNKGELNKGELNKGELNNGELNNGELNNGEFQSQGDRKIAFQYSRVYDQIEENLKELGLNSVFSPSIIDFIFCNFTTDLSEQFPKIAILCAPSEDILWWQTPAEEMDMTVNAMLPFGDMKSKQYIGETRRRILCLEALKWTVFLVEVTTPFYDENSNSTRLNSLKDLLYLMDTIRSDENG
ncbi:hypothetical protein IE077_003044 [Cardiosporidium cionae]|uniref:RAP domain-containing protein n=1 Tax=Cardiosporidium cionae TaxID=476202 RepID=A0ABQ7JGK9_9APIC|nr:hypothetical protein IE077_003044 [Cardiosporidium cionae]|eukprot:KAF8823123.1 hypothetical protein IE077_003044 [Cardiosporidium cionae]